MFYALAEDQSRVKPAPKTQAWCPVCRTEVRAKCGSIVAWHWAHKQRDCDPFSEPMTEWHLGWQEEVPEQYREYVIGPHRADILAPAGFIVELQHSSISPEEITEREKFYQRMVWVFDVREAANAKVYRTEYGYQEFEDYRLSIRRKANQNYVTFRWRQPRKSVGVCRKPILLDLGDDSLLYLKKIDTEAPCGGWGYSVTRAEVVAAMNGNNPQLANQLIWGAS